MYSSEDFEKLWFLYKLEGQPNNLSIESFCLQQGVPYQLFNKWFSSRKKSIVSVDIVGIPEKDHLEKVSHCSLPCCPHPESPFSVESVVITLSNGVQISKQHLSIWYLNPIKRISRTIIFNRRLMFSVPS